MARARKLARGAGCLGAVGLSGAMGIAGTLGLCGVGGWIAYRAFTAQWEDALRDTLARTTGDEITFRKLSIGFRSVTVHDLEVRDEQDGVLLHVDGLSLVGDPRELLGAPAAWHLDGLHLSGVALTPHRDGDGFALPMTTLALARGETPLPMALELPRLVVPEVTVDGLSVDLDGHRVDVLSARVAEGLEVTLPASDGASPVMVRFGPAEVRGLHIPEPGIRVDRALVALGTELTPDATTWPLEGVVLEGVGLSLDGLSATVPRVHAEGDVVLDLAAGPSLTVGTLQSDGFSLVAGNTFHCRDLRAQLSGPLTLADEEVVLDELVVTGLRSQATRSGWPATDALLSATRGARLPPVRAPHVTVRRTAIAAGDAEATAETTTTSLAFRPGERLAWGPGTVQGLRVQVAGTEQLTANRVDVSGGALVPGLPQLAFEELAAQGVTTSSSWTDASFGMPEGLLGLANVRGGFVFQSVVVDGLDLDVTGRSGTFPVHVDRVDASNLALQPDAVVLGTATASGVALRDGPFEARAQRIALAPQQAATLLPDEALEWGALTVQGVSLGGGGKVRLDAASVDVPGGRLTPSTAPLALPSLQVHGLTGAIVWGAHAFGVPEAVFRLGTFAGGIAVDDVAIDRADLVVHGQTGAIPVHVDRIDVDGLAMDAEGWSVPGGTLKGLEARWERVRATVSKATLKPDGAVHLEGTEAWTRLNEQRQLDLPPVAADHAPVWLGGQFRGAAPYFGVAFPGSPYTPTSIHAPATRLHLADEGIANPHHTWDLVLDVALGPHDSQGHLPVSVEGDIAGGRLAFQGHVKPNGTIAADVGVRGLVLGDLGMYLDAPMSRFNMAIEQGRGGAALRMDLEGSQISLRGQGSGRSLRMQGSALAGVANAGFGVVKGGDNTVSIPIEIEGDLADPAFSPFDLLLSSYVGGLHKSVAKSLGKAVKNIGGPDDGVARNKQTGGGRNADKAWGALKKALDGGSSDAVRAGKPEPEPDVTPTNLLDTAADTGRPEAVDTGQEQ